MAVAASTSKVGNIVDAKPGRTQSFATSSVARLVGLPPARVRALARAGLCHPARRGRFYCFSFQDVVLLRAATGLLKARIAPRRVREALRRLSEQLPSDRPLTGVRISANGGDIVVRADGTTWKPESGQVTFSFLVDDLARATRRVTLAQPRPSSAPQVAQGQSSDDWFERGLLLEEEGNTEAARHAYEKAVELDPDFGDAYVNLGRLVHHTGDAANAAGFYERALLCQPDDPVAHYNLALAFEDQKLWQQALAQYRHAIEVSPDFADAHFNLGQLYDRLGNHAEAMRHLRTYKSLVREV